MNTYRAVGIPAEGHVWSTITSNTNPQAVADGLAAVYGMYPQQIVMVALEPNTAYPVLYWVSGRDYQ